MNVQFFKELKHLVSSVLSTGNGDDLKKIQAAIFSLIEVFFPDIAILRRMFLMTQKHKSSVLKV